MSYLELNAELVRFQKSKSRPRGRRPSSPASPSNGGAVSQAAWRRRLTRPRARAFNAVDYRVPGLVPPIRQSSSNRCWAAATTMLVNWKHQQSHDVRTVIEGYGQPYLGYYDNDNVLPWVQANAFFTQVGMIIEPPQCPSIEGWLSFLRAYGPLIVRIRPSETQTNTHLVVIVAMSGDGSVAGTRFHLNDPGTGTEVTYTVEQLVRRFESVIGPDPTDPAAEARIWQIIHWPANAQSSAQSFARAKSRGFSSPEAFRSRAFTTPLAWGARVSEAFRNRVRGICGNLGCDPNHLMAAMAFETGETFSPSIRNRRSGATGLIQFMPATARGLGTTTDALAAMSAEDQLAFVERYFARFRNRLSTLEDVYMAILWPRAVGQPNTQVLFAQPTRAYELNRGLDYNNDGSVTKEEASSRVAAKLQRGLESANTA